MAVLYQVVEQGRQSALVCENTDGITDLHALLAQAAANMKHTGGGFMEALSRAGTELGVPFRQVLADEADALSHDLGHGGAAEQRILIDLDSGRIRVEYDHRADSLRESLETLADHFPTTATKIQNRLIAFLAEHDGSKELYEVLHDELGLTKREIEAIGFALTHRYEPDCSDAYQDIVDYIQFEQETAEIWPWLISGDEILAHETPLREIAGRLAAAGEWDTESIYDGLTEAFGNNPSLNNPSEFSPKPIACRKEESTIKITQNQLDLLWQLEEFRKKHEHQAEPSDWAIRMCEAFVARSMGFTDRTQWTELLRQRGETLFTFDWKSGSISDHVAQWCRENHRDWRYSHLGELQVAHGGEWRNFDPDEVFGTNVASAFNDDWLNVYANFDWKTGRIDSALTVCLVCSDGHEFEFSYPLTPAEQAQLWDKMDAYCRQQNGQSLEEARAALLQTQAEEGMEIRM